MFSPDIGNNEGMEANATSPVTSPATSTTNTFGDWAMGIIDSFDGGVPLSDPMADMIATLENGDMDTFPAPTLTVDHTDGEDVTYVEVLVGGVLIGTVEIFSPRPSFYEGEEFGQFTETFEIRAYGANVEGIGRTGVGGH